MAAVQGKGVTMPSYYEFFAGGGMVRAGLGSGMALPFRK